MALFDQSSQIAFVFLGDPIPNDAYAFAFVKHLIFDMRSPKRALTYSVSAALRENPEETSWTACPVERLLSKRKNQAMIYLRPDRFRRKEYREAMALKGYVVVCLVLTLNVLV